MGAYRFKLNNSILSDGLGLLVDFVGDVLGGGATIGHIVFNTKVILWSTGVMRGCKEDATISLVLPDDVRRGGGREDSVGADDKLSHIVRGCDLDDDLDGLWREITTVATNNERESLGLDGIQNCLHEVLRVVLLNVDGYQGLIGRNPLNARDEILPLAGTP